MTIKQKPFNGFFVGHELRDVIGMDRIEEKQIYAVSKKLNELYPQYRWVVADTRSEFLYVGANPIDASNDSPPPFGHWDEDGEGRWEMQVPALNSRKVLNVEWANTNERKQIYAVDETIEAIIRQFASGKKVIDFTLNGKRYLYNRAHIISMWCISYED